MFNNLSSTLLLLELLILQIKFVLITSGQPTLPTRPLDSENFLTLEKAKINFVNLHQSL